MGFGDHARGTDVGAGVDEGVLPDHAGGLVAGGGEGGVGGVEDGVLGVVGMEVSAFEDEGGLLLVLVLGWVLCLLMST